jgi:hypothetical protein
MNKYNIQSLQKITEEFTKYLPTWKEIVEEYEEGKIDEDLMSHYNNECDEFFGKMMEEVDSNLSNSETKSCLLQIKANSVKLKEFAPGWYDTLKHYLRDYIEL